MSKVLGWFDNIANRFFHSQGALKAAEAMQKQAEEKAAYWEKAAGRWRKEFNNVYDLLQEERQNARTKN
jgi:hypothetical protein